MSDRSVDVLMVTYERPEYTRRALARVLEIADDDVRVWIWHNGTHEPTLEVVRSFLGDPHVHEFRHSVENARLAGPIAWLWANARGAYLSKVDDDCLVPERWTDVLRRAHEDVPEFGVLGCWRFREEDFLPDVAARKIRNFGGHRILQNTWVEGSGFLMKRACVETLGIPKPHVNFPMYCKRLAMAGWVNGWYYPFLYQEHMDDPRSPYSLLRTEEDFRRNTPLTAQEFGVESLEERIAQIRAFARGAQEASPDPRAYRGWKAKVRRRLRRLVGS